MLKNDIILSSDDFLPIRQRLKEQNQKLVFTNGCFDILHAGHVDYINKAKEKGDKLIVALNTDESVRRIKGAGRPVISQEERAFIISNLKVVDYVTFFNEDTPKEIIDKLIPDVLVKGSDWSIDNIVGRETVESNGGMVKTIDFISDQSTSKIIDKILRVYGK
jgi:D-beta-D-heptose 7-phosphate kinase/D-beta-D-heptose 1-phosphate adenosyltransferase